jgi:hypothetical protein
MGRIACVLVALACAVPIGASAVSVGASAADNSTREALVLPAVVAAANESATRTAIPASARILRISVHGSLKGEQPKQRMLHVTSAKKIDKVVALLNALPAGRPGMTRCPVDFGIRVRLAFYTSRVSPPSALAEVDPQGCGSVQLTIGGKSQPALEGGGLLIRRIDHVLGVKLNVGPIFHTIPS